MKNRMNCTRTKWRMDELIPFVIYPGTKLLAQQGIESIMYPEQQQRPLPSLLSSSFFYGMFWWINQKSGSFQDGGVLSNVYSGICAGSNSRTWGYYSGVQSGYSKMLFIDDKLVPNDVHSKMFGCTVLSEDRNIRKRKLWQK